MTYVVLYACIFNMPESHKEKLLQIYTDLIEAAATVEASKFDTEKT